MAKYFFQFRVSRQTLVTWGQCDSNPDWSIYNILAELSQGVNSTPRAGKHPTVCSGINITPRLNVRFTENLTSTDHSNWQ